VTALVVSPDYLSHYLPLSALGSALRHRGHDVFVATGSGLRDRVLGDGFAHLELQLGAGRNRGLARIEDQTGDAGKSLARFLAATERGMVATLEHQAHDRLDDLLWEPEVVTARLRRIVRDVEPSIIVSDQLAFGASLALRALEVPYAAFLPGHPCQLPSEGEPFGFPSRRPAEFAPSRGELERLHSLCTRVSTVFTARFNAVLHSLSPHARPVADAFAAGSPWLTLINYPRQLAGYRRFPVGMELIGSCVRNEPDCELGALSRHGARPRAYVALGSFLSARSDVLSRIAAALRDLGWDALIATGTTSPRELGPIPSSWITRPFLRQVAALRSCDIVVCHGGNNTVTEALTEGLPILAAPFSTDQFAGAADLVDSGLGAAVDPNRASPTDIGARLKELLANGAPARAAALGRQLRSAPGADRAAELLERKFRATPGRGSRPSPSPARRSRSTRASV
jgi:UDP:flavonoid glycosyltransferase YjiC (YdhE family)